MLRHRDQDTIRLALFPNLDYAGLHQSIVALVDIMPLIQYGTQGMCNSSIFVSICKYAQ